MRPLFKLTLIILSLIPLFFAVTGLIGGAASNNGGVAVSAGLDNQYRYLSGYYLSLFFGRSSRTAPDAGHDRHGIRAWRTSPCALAPIFRTVPRPGCPVDI